MSNQINNYTFHTTCLTEGHRLHADKKCYCKYCSSQTNWRETSITFGAVYCKVCEEQHNETSLERRSRNRSKWIHAACPKTGCGEHCPNDRVVTIGQSK